MKTASIVYSIINLVGLLLVPLAIIRMHQDQIERGSSFGDGLALASFVIPIAVVCLSVDLAWVGMAIAHIIRHREKAALVASLVCIGLWGVLVAMIMTGHLPQ